MTFVIAIMFFAAGWFFRMAWDEMGETKADKLASQLQWIVHFVVRDRPRGYHLYPTRFRDEAIVLLHDLGYGVKSYADCVEDTCVDRV